MFVKKIIFYFSETNVLLCDFHREQAWGRWLNATKNNMRNRKDDAKLMLRNIASSECHEEYLENVEKLKKSNLWVKEDSKQFRNWIDKTWLPVHRVCSCVKMTV